jgi:hypothetical protein
MQQRLTTLNASHSSRKSGGADFAVNNIQSKLTRPNFEKTSETSRSVTFSLKTTKTDKMTGVSRHVQRSDKQHQNNDWDAQEGMGNQILEFFFHK